MFVIDFWTIVLSGGRLDGWVDGLLVGRTCHCLVDDLVSFLTLKIDLERERAIGTITPLFGTHPSTQNCRWYGTGTECTLRLSMAAAKLTEEMVSFQHLSVQLLCAKI